MCLAPQLKPSKKVSLVLPTLDDIETPLKPDALPADTLTPRLWSAATLLGLGMSSPILLAASFVSAIGNAIIAPRSKPTSDNRRVAIVTGGKMTKSLMLVKQLKAQGCRVVLVETSKYWMVASRFSNCVDRFVTVPVPEKDTAAFLMAIKAIAMEEGADLYVPVTSPVASQYEALVADVLPEKCHSWSLTAEETQALDDKVTFCQAAEALGLSVPSSHRISHPDEARAFNAALLKAEACDPSAKRVRYIFKSIKYDSMHRLDLFTLPCEPAKLDAYLSELDVSEERPWIMQTFLEGDEYSTCAFVKEGKVLAFSDNRASISCFNYLPARNSKLREWVQTFCAARCLSGIVCIDFFVEADGTPYAIECNPRASSNIASFYNNPKLGAALLSPEATAGTVEPDPSALETYWLFAEVWAAVTAPGLTLGSLYSRASNLVRTLRHKKDAYWDPADPLPFLALHLIHIPTLLIRNIIKGNRWAKVDPCIGKLTEENGD